MVSYVRLAFAFALFALMATKTEGGNGLVLPKAIHRNFAVLPVEDNLGQQHGFWCVGHSTVNDIHSRLEFMFTTYLFPRFRNRFFQTDNSSLTYYKFRIGIIRVIEFNDTTGNGFTSLSQNGSIVRHWSLVGLGNKFTQTTIQPFMIVSQNTSVKAYQVTTSITNAEGATLTLTAALAESTIRDTLHNRELNPNAVKFNVDIANLTYHSPISKIAIIASLDAIAANGLAYVPNTNTPVDSTVAEDELDVGTEGRVTWVNKVTTTAINGVTGSVPITYATLGADLLSWSPNATLEALDSDFDGSELRTLVAFTFNTNLQPPSYSWDPNAQTTDGPTSVTSSTGPSSTGPSSTGSPGSGASETKTTFFSFFIFLSIVVAFFA